MSYFYVFLFFISLSLILSSASSKPKLIRRYQTKALTKFFISNFQYDDRRFLLTDVVYCWSLLCCITIGVLFSFEFISYCAYLIIIFVRQADPTDTALGIVRQTLSLGNASSPPPIVCAPPAQLKKSPDRVLIIIGANETKESLLRAPLISNYKLKRIFLFRLLDPWKGNCENRHQ